MEYERYAWRHRMNPSFQRKEVTLLDASLSYQRCWVFVRIVWENELPTVIRNYPRATPDGNLWRRSDQSYDDSRDRCIAMRTGNMFLMIVNVFLETDSSLRYLRERLRTILEYCSWYPIDLKIIIVQYSRVSRKTIQCNQIRILDGWCWSCCQLFMDLLVRLGTSVVRTEENSVIALRILFRIDRVFINILMTEARVCHSHIHVTDDLGNRTLLSNHVAIRIIIRKLRSQSQSLWFRTDLIYKAFFLCHSEVTSWRTHLSH